MLAITRLTAILLVITLVSAECRADDVLFKDDFKNGLSAKWEVSGLEKSDYRFRDGGLEMRVQPGQLTAKTPMLKLALPFSAKDTVFVSVKVTVLNEFTQDHEVAGVYLLDATGPDFGATKERVDGKLVFAPGDYEFIGKEGEEGDVKKYKVNYIADNKAAGPLRILVDRGNAFFQVGPSADDKFQNHFYSAIDDRSHFKGFCLTATGAPDKSSHWVRFEDFRVVKR